MKFYERLCRRGMAFLFFMGKFVGAGCRQGRDLAGECLAETSERGVRQWKSGEAPRRDLWAGRKAVEKWRSAPPGDVSGAYDKKK